MASIIGRSAFRATRALRSSGANAGANAGVDRQAGKEALKEGAKRDPELYVLAAIMTGVGGLAGWYFTSNPTTATSEARVHKVAGSEPWNQGNSGAAYQYYASGNPADKRDAPSPLNVTIVPNVTLPKELHDTFNKYGKDETEW